MKFRASPESAIRCVKFCVRPIFSWPPPLSASKSDLILRDILFVLALFFPVIIVEPVIVTLASLRDDITEATKTLSAFIAISFAIIKMTICRYHRSRFQVFCTELEEFVKKADSRERELMERYMRRYAPLYAIVGSFSFVTLFFISIGPTVLPQSLPVEINLPYSIEKRPDGLVITYILEIWMGLEAVAAVCVDIQIALLLWFHGIQFELLAEEFARADSLLDFTRCIEKHQKLLSSTNELIFTIHYIVIAVVVITTLGNICTGYQFVNHPPIATVAQFIFMLSVMSMEVLTYAWPADNLMALSENIAYAVYSSPWMGKSPEILRTIQFVMLRAQKPVVISFGGILPELDLEFYAKYLMTSFSYITTLKAIFGKMTPAEA